MLKHEEKCTCKICGEKMVQVCYKWHPELENYFLAEKKGRKWVFKEPLEPMD